MIVISDTTPLNYLILIGRVDILTALFGKIRIPPAVCEELGHSASPHQVRSWIQQPPSWLVVSNPAIIDAELRLGRGEKESISLADELNADLLLMDDRVARRAAERRGLAVSGTVNILEVAARRGIIDLRTAIGDLRTTNFHISERILAEMLRAEALRRQQREY